MLGRETGDGMGAAAGQMGGAAAGLGEVKEGSSTGKVRWPSSYLVRAGQCGTGRGHKHPMRWGSVEQGKIGQAEQGGVLE